MASVGATLNQSSNGSSDTILNGGSDGALLGHTLKLARQIGIRFTDMLPQLVRIRELLIIGAEIVCYSK